MKKAAYPVIAALAATIAISSAFAQKKEEEPFWAIGRPKGDATAKMAPVPALPIATAADKLPIKKIKLPPGFKVEVYQAGVLDARGMREGDKGTVFVSSLFVAGKIYAISNKGGKRELKTIAEKLFLPNGIEFNKGALYVATPKDITRYDNIEANLDNIPQPVDMTEAFKLPPDVHHNWKFLAAGPDNKIYIQVGSPCNLCEINPGVHGQIRRYNFDGTGMEIMARGVRNSVGFDFHPKTGELWFTDNGRDTLGDEQPNDELNHAARAGLHFGYPYCHEGAIADPEFGKARKCAEFTPPAQKLGPHVAALGLTFYTGTMFPAEYRKQLFIVNHGSWNRTPAAGHTGYRVMLARIQGDKVVSYEPFITGWLLPDNRAWGRPVDILVAPDGALLISDDRANLIYRVSYH